MSANERVSGQTPGCPVCGLSLSMRLAKGRKSNKPFVMLICPGDGRHFRAFITFQPYVKQVLDNLEASGESIHQPGGRS